MKHLVLTELGGTLMFEIAPMQLLSDNKVDLTKLISIWALYLHIWDDYSNLCQEQYAKEKGYCEDLTGGKFSFPVIHAIKSHPDDSQVMRILLFQIHSLADTLRF
ncbi:hypothetical protein Cfor_06751 [Coptotermes formosanus]|uniref:Uncharacterized protein n=1 Tax=Coptotermes formosanus TaxID=36987 RepID=A0A6L2PQM7_COPFO|nr:hypothetical protein Cfor_06751 [Coptotermes formosanus]